MSAKEGMSDGVSTGGAILVRTLIPDRKREGVVVTLVDACDGCSKRQFSDSISITIGGAVGTGRAWRGQTSGLASRDDIPAGGYWRDDVFLRTNGIANVQTAAPCLHRAALRKSIFDSNVRLGKSRAQYAGPSVFEAETDTSTAVLCKIATPQLAAGEAQPACCGVRHPQRIA
jgi:hypothetical protein